MDPQKPFQKEEEQSFYTKNSSTLSSISFGKVLKSRDKSRNGFQVQNSVDSIQQKCKITMSEMVNEYQIDPCSDYFAICCDQKLKMVKLANENYGQYIQSFQEQDFRNKLKQKGSNTYKIGRLSSLLKKLQLMQPNNQQQTNQNHNQTQSKQSNLKSNLFSNNHKMINPQNNNNQTNQRIFSFFSIINSQQKKSSVLNQQDINQISQLGLQSQLKQIGLQSKIKIQKQLSQIKEYPKKQIIQNIKDRNNPEKGKYQKYNFNNEKITKSQGIIKGLQFSKKLKKKKYYLKEEQDKNNADNPQSKFNENLIRTSEFKI